MAKNNNLHKAKTAKNDEFYTRIEDINEELKHYSDHFREKIVLCNCDDPEWSNFWRYFHLEFERLGLKKLIATHYEPDEVPSYMMEYTGGNDEDFSVGIRKELTQNGDFRSPECIELLKKADIVVTNPPFSLFREYVAQLAEYDKKFIIIGAKNCITYKEIFSLIRDNKMWIGAKQMSGSLWFETPKNYSNKNDKIVGDKKLTPIACCWFTNLDHPKRHLPIETAYEYKKKDRLYPDLYPKYDNYDAINVDKVSQIPMDYEPCWYKCPHKDKCEYAASEGKVDNALCESACNGAMGVPITYLDKYSPEQFEIIDANNIRNNDAVSEKPHGLIKDKEATITLNSCSQFVNVERERERENAAQRMQELSFAGCRKCNGVLGVPITFLDKYCPEQFRIVKFRKENDDKDLCVNRKSPYFRILIQKM